MSAFMNAANKQRRARGFFAISSNLWQSCTRCGSILCTTRSFPPSVKIGGGTSFGYKGIGVVIHKRAKIGKNCVIAQGVTIGGRSGHYEVPVIGDNCCIGAGAKVLGANSDW